MFQTENLFREIKVFLKVKDNWITLCLKIAPTYPNFLFPASLRFWTRCKRTQKMSSSVWALVRRTTKTLLGSLPDFSPTPPRPEALTSSSSWRPRCRGLRWRIHASCWPVSVPTDPCSAFSWTSRQGSMEPNPAFCRLASFDSLSLVSIFPYTVFSEDG